MITGVVMSFGVAAEVVPTVDVVPEVCTGAVFAPTKECTTWLAMGVPKPVTRLNPGAVVLAAVLAM